MTPNMTALDMKDIKNREVSEYQLEQYVLGELAEEYRQHIQSLLETDTNLQARLTRLEESNREIMKKYPPQMVVPQILQRFETEHVNKRDTKREKPRVKRFKKRFWILSPALVPAIILVLLFLPRTRNKIPVHPYLDPVDVTTAKGPVKIDMNQTQLLVHRNVNNKVELLRDGTSGKAGDLLQLGYLSVSQPYGVIFSIDGCGGVTLHYPEDKNRPASLVLNKKIVLPEAIELDNAPGFERFFFITSDTPLDVEKILKDAKALAADIEAAKAKNLDLPKNVKQYSTIIIKKSINR